jgi:hypothetical protein
MASYIDIHWNVFANTPYEPAGAIGHSPRDWVVMHNLQGVQAELSSEKHDRKTVRSICQDSSIPVLQGYIEIMAWGSQGGGPGGSRHVLSAWAEKERIERVLKMVRAGDLTRRQGYNLFLMQERVPGLGPAYWTKLLYFFNPDRSLYIMDQWTAKSVNLLVGQQLVRLQGDTLCNKNKAGNYQAYCEEIDEMARILKADADQVEEMLMSKGGRNPKPWRTYVKSHYGYDPSILYSKYPHIPAAEF